MAMKSGCLAVYHEWSEVWRTARDERKAQEARLEQGKTVNVGRKDWDDTARAVGLGRYTDDQSVFRSRGTRYGAWHDYERQPHAIVEFFRYKYVPLDDFIGLCGSNGTLPGTWGKKHPEWNRIDFVGRWPYERLYAHDQTKDGKVASRIDDAIDFVVRHIVDPSCAEGQPGRHIAICVRGKDARWRDWKSIEKRVLREWADIRDRGEREREGKGNPFVNNENDRVCVYGSPEVVEDYLAQQRAVMTGDDDGIVKSRRYYVEIIRPDLWKNWFCARYDRVDIYGSDWQTADDITISAQELVCPWDSRNTLGIITGVGLIEEEGERVGGTGLVAGFARPKGYRQTTLGEEAYTKSEAVLWDGVDPLRPMDPEDVKMPPYLALQSLYLWMVVEYEKPLPRPLVERFFGVGLEGVPFLVGVKDIQGDWPLKQTGLRRWNTRVIKPVMFGTFDTPRYRRYLDYDARQDALPEIKPGDSKATSQDGKATSQAQSQ